MIDVTNVLQMLRPEGGWAVDGNSFDGAQFFECEPVTKKEFDDGVKEYDAWKTEQDTAKATAKDALLAQLGITEEQAKLLLS